MSLLMLAVVVLFPVVLLALLLITSGLEGRVVRQPTPKVGAGERPGATRASRPGVSATWPGGRAVVGACHRLLPRTPPCPHASGRPARPAT